MVFSSLEFLFLFLPAVALLYYLSPGKLRNGLLLFASLFFYAWGEPVYVLLMIGSIILNYCIGLLLGRTEGSPGKRRAVLIIGTALDLALLAVFKYSAFAVTNVNALLRLSLKVPAITLPIGISFFTFQAMSYVFDVYAGNARVQKNPLNFGLYISLFPQLIAGPIVRYSDVEAQINERRVTAASASEGTRRFIIGLAKKVLLANSVGALWDTVAAADRPDALFAWLGAVAFSFQIYFDFSGYSDMAIGLGKIFGFTFLENFDHPYVSSSVTEFWRRWHISLGTWFREYVYIPLGGNRKGKAKQIRNILIVWMLTGLWHGASWNFVLWGLYYGVLLLIEKLFLKKLLDKLPAAVSHIYTLLVVLFGWVLFACEDTGTLVSQLSAMFFANGAVSSASLFALGSNAVLFITLIFASLELPGKLAARLKDKVGEKAFLVFELLWLLALFILSVAFLVDSTYNPFIYFRF